MSRVLVLGSYVQDHCWATQALPRPGESRIGRFSTGPGGKGFNQAVAAHRLGAATCFYGAIGRDALGQTARSFAASEGLACHWCETDTATAASSIVVDADGRNQICVALGANDALPESVVSALQAELAPGSWLVSQLETALPPVTEAFAAARAAGVHTLLNPAPINPAVTAGLLQLADLLTPNETEFEFLVSHLLGEHLQLNPAAVDQAQLHALCRRLLPKGTVVVTLGAEGAFVSHPANSLRGDRQAHYLVAPAPVRAIDTTGAGDAFSGALAAVQLLRPDWPFAEQVRFACQSAGLSTERPGTAPAMATWNEVQSRFGAG